MAGRLTLTWANKDKALLSHGETGYEWVERDDPRASEVRLLDEVSVVGDAVGTPADNLLIRGDSLDAVRALVRTPEYAEVYRGKVKLVYIDPPFNTGQAFEHYDDSLEHSVWLGMMRERLMLIRDLLAPDGSVWVHLDDAEMAYCRVLMASDVRTLLRRSHGNERIRLVIPQSTFRRMSISSSYSRNPSTTFKRTCLIVQPTWTRNSRTRITIHEGCGSRLIYPRAISTAKAPLR